MSSFHGDDHMKLARLGKAILACPTRTGVTASTTPEVILEPTGAAVTCLHAPGPRRAPGQFGQGLGRARFLSQHSKPNSIDVEALRPHTERFVGPRESIPQAER